MSNVAPTPSLTDPLIVAIRHTSCYFTHFSKTLVGKPACVELKNDLSLTGTLESVDQYLNVKLSNVDVVDKERFPQLLACKDSLYVVQPYDTYRFRETKWILNFLQDAARKETMS